MDKDTEITGEKLAHKGQFQKGEDPRRNLAGRPPESLNFKTKWLLFIDKIAKQNNITPDEVDEQLLKVAYKQMQSGDFRYWKDIQDRVHGTAINNSDITSNGQSILVIPQELITKNDTDTLPEPNSEGQTQV